MQVNAGKLMQIDAFILVYVIPVLIFFSAVWQSRCAVITKRIKDNKRPHSAGFAYRLKYWAHCATGYVSMATYPVVTSPDCLRPRTFVCYAVLPLQYWVIYVFYVKQWKR